MNSLSSSRRLSDQELDFEINTWTDELLSEGINPDNLEECYQKAKVIRRRDNPTNHYRLACSELVSAKAEIEQDKKDAEYRHKLQNPKCDICEHAHSMGKFCPYHDKKKIGEFLASNTEPR